MEHNFHALVELYSGLKCEGRITHVDKTNMKIIMTNVTRYSSSQNDENINKEYFPELTLDKEEIKEVRKMNYESHSHINFPVPDNIKIKHKYSDGFFDNLNVLSHDEAANENYKYNEKNQETFFSKSSNRFFTPKARYGKEKFSFQKRNFYSPQYDYYDFNDHDNRSNYNYRGYDNYNYNYYGRRNYNRNQTYLPRNSYYKYQGYN